MNAYMYADPNTAEDEDDRPTARAVREHFNAIRKDEGKPDEEKTPKASTTKPMTPTRANTTTKTTGKRKRISDDESETDESDSMASPSQTRIRDIPKRQAQSAASRRYAGEMNDRDGEDAGAKNQHSDESDQDYDLEQEKLEKLRPLKRVPKWRRVVRRM